MGGTLLPALLVLSLASWSYAQVPGTHVAVAENQSTGQFFMMEPRLHVWPRDPRTVPFLVAAGFAADLETVRQVVRLIQKRLVKLSDAVRRTR